ncbi:peptide chain release factor 2 [Streptococcus pneumoniae]|nr:peptide chain release factor 2 [Streptococcus pneumoniae]
MTEPDFWNDNIAAQKTSQELNELKNTYNTFHKMEELQDEVEILLDFLAEDESVHDELVAQLAELDKIMTSYEMTLLLSEPYDHNNAILEIHPGSGGTEAQDWGDMLLRMYTRYGNAKGFKVEVLDYQAGDEAGIKSVTLSFEGPNAYGLLKSEMGVHRLVRISPFDSAKRRHTSFTSVEVMPELDDTIEVEIREDEIAAESVGVNTTKIKIIAFVFGAITASIAGSLQAGFIGSVVPKDYTFINSINVLIIVVFGGLGSITGAIVSAIVLGILNMLLQDVASVRMIIYALALVLVMIFRPGGLLGTWELSLSRFFKKSKKEEQN